MLMNSIWKPKSPVKTAELSSDISCQTAVIGGGMAGFCTAFLLERAGADVTVFEQGEILNGATLGTTAKITPQHGAIYSRLEKKLGAQTALGYFEANSRAVESFADIIEQNKIRCGFTRRRSGVYTGGLTEKITAEYEACRRIGINAKIAQADDLPFSATAVYIDNCAQFNPIAFGTAIAQRLKIYSRTKILRIDGTTLYTEKGNKITAENIVIATHFPIVDIPGFFFARLHQSRSCVIALKNVKAPETMYIEDSLKPHSFREYNGMLLVGGEGYRTGENAEGGCYKRLLNYALALYPNAQEVCRWSAQDCITPDGIPFIGRVTANNPNLYVATGFNKWGMSSSMVSAMIITDLIMKGESEYADIFTPARLNLSASAGSIANDMAHAVKGLTLHAFESPRGIAEAMEKGHGGIVELEGKKLGVYKADNGELYTVSPFCTHMGCQLEWNPDEKSWDCPCHGSRFDYKGNVLSNPAKKDLE